MNIDFIIVSGILVIICFLPFILCRSIVNAKKKYLGRKFKEEALRLSYNITFELNWNTNIVGIDILKKQFLFVQELESDYIIHHIDLNKISQVKLLSHYSKYSLHNKLVQTLSRLDLEFYENNTSGLLTVNLYNYDLNYTEDFEIKNAENIVSELKKYLNVMPILKHSA
jgi:hypothetical protein